MGSIGPGVLALVAAERGDGEAQAQRLGERLLGYRIFADKAGKMNLSLLDRAADLLAADLLVVPQFTLAADTRKGSRPSFSGAADPQQGRVLFSRLLESLHERFPGEIASGIFGADMQVTLTNDGPVTFWLRAAPAAG